MNEKKKFYVLCYSCVDAVPFIEDKQFQNICWTTTAHLLAQSVNNANAHKVVSANSPPSLLPLVQGPIVSLADALKLCAWLSRLHVMADM